MERNDAGAVLNRAVGRRVAQAASSLERFALTLDDGAALLAEARDAAAPRVDVRLVTAAELPPLADAVCAVDWGWLLGATIAEARLDNGQLRLHLDPAGPLTVSAAVWQGSPFLAFQPYRAPTPA